MTYELGMFSSFTDLFHDSAIQLVITILITLLTTILGSIISYWFARRQGRKELAYHSMYSYIVLSVSEEIAGRIDIRFENKTVKNLFLTIIELWNSGSTPIIPEDFRESITLSFSEQDAEIFDTEIVSTQPSGIKATLSHTSSHITLNPLLLNQNDRIRLKILSSEHLGTLSVAGRIVGIQNFIDYQYIHKKRAARSRILEETLQIMSVMLAFVGLSILFAGTTTVTIAHATLVFFLFILSSVCMILRAIFFTDIPIPSTINIFGYKLHLWHRKHSEQMKH